MNKDPGLLLTWLPIDGHELDFKFNFSRQGNRYAGDSAGGGVQADVDDENLIGLETNRMLRRTLPATHRGEYRFGGSRRYIQWENTPEAVIEGSFPTEYGDGEYARNLTKMIEYRDKRTGNALSLVPDHRINASLDWYAR